MALTSVKKQLLLDGIPQTLMFAEFHYYRTPKDQWEDKIKLIIEAGFNGVASYIPWLIHEFQENDFDFTGIHRGEHDLIGFIELLQSYDLYFIPRPGPFIMAEMKNDGIPFWVYEKYPEIKPISWNDQPGTTVTVDYTNPNFLNASKHYYEAIIPLLSNYMYPKGNIVALQLDNEVGMLSWVSNRPELNDNIIKSFMDYIKNNNIKYPFSSLSFEDQVHAIRYPQETYLNQLHVDLLHFFRLRLRDYIFFLKETAIQLGFNENLFIINIHGCSAGRSTTYPIGLSQLYESYYGQKDMISGSDLYINDFDVPRFQDSYMANIITDALNDNDQVLTSLEFSAGTGDYGDNFSQRYSTSRIDFMTRYFVAQGNRILNFYSFVGGRNYRLETDLKDGNNRISTTGEHHGFAAPIDPFGNKSYVYDKTKEVVNLISNHQSHLATQYPVYDDITYGFIPDYFMTEFHYPEIRPEIHQNITKYRAGMFWDVISKSLLLLNYSFDATDLQRFNPDPKKLLLLPSATYMAKEIQEKIVSFLKQDGKLLLYGELPRFDMTGQPCQILADYLELEFIQNEKHEPHPFRSSIVAKNLAAGRVELHRPYFQTWRTAHLEDVIFSVYHLNEDCGFFFNKPQKHALIMTCEYHSDLELFERFMHRFGINKNIQASKVNYHGLFILQTKDQKDQSYMHVMNLDDFDKTVNLNIENNTLNLYLEAKTASMLPINLCLLENLKVLYTTNEISKFDNESFTVRLNGPTFKMIVETTKNIQVDNPYTTITKQDHQFIIEKHKRDYLEKEVTFKLI